MELKELTEKTMKLFEVNKPDELISCFEKITLNNDFEKYKKFKELVINLEEDWLQKIFQYYLADKEDKKQDYTPVSLARLVARLTELNNEKVCLDLCAGSGALTIQKWKTNKSLKFICKELDNQVIWFLLFNLAVRNIEGYVILGDSLDETKETIIYKLSADEEFSKIEIVNKCDLEADTCMSNPPYNISWEVSLLAEMDKRFILSGVPPKSNANYAFVLTGLNYADKAAFILPNSVLGSGLKEEVEIRKNLVENNWIEAIILNPDRMFESTSIATCILVLNKNKNTSKIEMIDMSNYHGTEEREQRGQYGNTAHTNRIYKKQVNVYNEEHIDFILENVAENKIEIGKSTSVSILDIQLNDYRLMPKLYIGQGFQEEKTRSYTDIVNDLNRVIRQKNCCKLTINESLAKQLGFEVEFYKSKYDKKFLEMVKTISKEKITRDNYITFSRNKNEIKFENADKEIISHIILMILQGWKEFIFYLNTEENRYLAELRDKLIPDLMSGKLEI